MIWRFFLGETDILQLVGFSLSYFLDRLRELEEARMRHRKLFVQLAIVSFERIVSALRLARLKAVNVPVGDLVLIEPSVLKVGPESVPSTRLRKDISAPWNTST